MAAPVTRRETLKGAAVGSAMLGSTASVNAGTAPAESSVSIGAKSTTPLPSLGDYEIAAKTRLSEGGWAYFSSGAADEITMHRNRMALDAVRLMPRVLVDVAKIDTEITLLGERLAHPILVAPSSSHVLAHPAGEVATVKGAGMAGAIMIASTGSNRSIEDICAAATGPVWFQLYLLDDRALAERLIRRAEAAGAKALVVTADNPLGYARNREDRMGNRMPMIPFPNLGTVAKPGGIASKRRFQWRDLDWIKSVTRLPIILKGILNPGDAETAIKYGVAAIVVSNHGGRVLDTLPATIEALPAVATRVAGRIPVLFDSGVRRGTDVLKAIGAGASAVLIGRPVIYGLAVNGAEGVRDVFNILKREFEGAMALTGRRRIAEIDKTIFWRSSDLDW